MTPPAMHPNAIHAAYMDDYQSGRYWRSLFGNGTPQIIHIDDYYAIQIDRWNEQEGADCPRDFCTDRVKAMEWSKP